MTRFRFLPVPSGSLFSTLLKYYSGSLGYGGLAQRLQYIYTYECIYVYIEDAARDRRILGNRSNT